MAVPPLPTWSESTARGRPARPAKGGGGAI
jgi:hypothetical protein